MGATVTYVPMMDYQQNGVTVTGGLSAILPTLEALNGLAPGTLTSDLLAHRELVFFDDIHPTAQVHALFGSYAQALLAGTPWVETLPLTGVDVDYAQAGSIAVAGEVDSLSIALAAGTTYRFDMLGISSLGTAGSLADPALRLVGPSGAIAGANADDGAGFDAMLNCTVAASGTYTLQCSATGGLTGAYTMQATVVGGAAMLAGNSYAVSNSATLVIEAVGGIGQDVVLASASYALTPGSEIELLATANAKGKTAINLTGNEFSQAITGNGGSNILEGKGGADVFTGGSGKDIFVLSNSAVTSPGAANLDKITDYERGEIVDITQILKVATGINVATGGYVRVTTGGLIQVDVDGGGNDWVTLSSINGSSAVSVRYVAGGGLATVSLGRVADSASQAQGLDTLMAAWGGGEHGQGGDPGHAAAPLGDAWEADVYAFHPHDAAWL
jgi:Ca2+-binding RTX toxin-like protein